MTTPLRRTGTPAPGEYRRLGTSDVAYADGAEDAVLAMVRATADRSSTSDDMVGHATDWAGRYHSDPMRANVLRAFDLPADARVLEVGAGSGVLSRYLGETCALVDTVEPMAARAAAAAERCADQDNVAVYVGELGDVPAEETYDVILVIGVLEYVGGGSADLTAKRAFLAQCAERLADGGTLLLAIENQLGVKYLAGAAEDHTNRFFDGLEGYPGGGKARTFSRAALTGLIAETGLVPTVLGAFPDYKLTRFVCGDLPAAAASLAWRIPAFPSPDWVKKRPKITDERALWRELVQAGVGADFANSFVVLASKGAAAPPLWPATRAGVFYSTGRRPQYVTQTRIDTDGDTVVLRRTPLLPGAAPAGTGGRLRLVCGDADYVPGTDLVEVIAAGGFDVAEPYLRRWVGLVDEAVSRGDGTAFDLVPTNLVLTDDDELTVIDHELALPDATRMQVLRRGLYLTAKAVTRLAPPARWEGCRTVGDVMDRFAALLGLPDTGVAELLADEVRVQAEVRERRPHDIGDGEWAARIERGMRRHLATRLGALPLGDRLPAAHARLRKKVAGLEASVAAAAPAAPVAPAAPAAPAAKPGRPSLMARVKKTVRRLR